MRLIDADALKKEWGFGDKCEECPQNVRICQYEQEFSRMDICEMLDDAPTVCGWISVEDRLPEKHLINDHEADVLLYIPKRDGCRQHGIYLGFLRETPMPPDDGSGNFWGRPCPGSDWTVWGWSHFEEPIVTHWMPLPEVPKEDADAVHN